METDLERAAVRLLARGITDARRIKLAAEFWTAWVDVCDAEDGVTHAIRDRYAAASWAMLAELHIAGVIDHVERVKLWVEELPQVGDVVDSHEFDNETWSMVVQSGWLRS
jgi:hypothetical protein